MLRLERHRLGPRLYVLGLRIHEFALGFAVLAVLLAGGLAETWEVTRAVEGAMALGTWLVLKDWRDLVPSKRNTAAWSLLPHKVPRRSHQCPFGECPPASGTRSRGALPRPRSRP